MRRKFVLGLALLFGLTGLVMAEEPSLDSLVQGRKVHQVLILNGPATTLTYFKRPGLSKLEADLVDRASEERYVLENYRSYLPNQAVPTTLEVRQQAQVSTPLWPAVWGGQSAYYSSGMWPNAGPNFGAGFGAGYGAGYGAGLPLVGDGFGYGASSQTTYRWTPGNAWQGTPQTPPSLPTVQTLVAIQSPASGANMAATPLFQVSAPAKSKDVGVSFSQEVGKGKVVITLKGAGAGEKITGTITNWEAGWVTLTTEDSVERIRESEIARISQSKDGVKPAGGPGKE